MYLIHRVGYPFPVHIFWSLRIILGCILVHFYKFWMLFDTLKYQNFRRSRIKKKKKKNRDHDLKSFTFWSNKSESFYLREYLSVL